MIYLIWILAMVGFIFGERTPLNFAIFLALIEIGNKLGAF